MIADDAIRVTCLVDVDPEAAFRMFTEDIDVWWRRGPAYRGIGPAGRMCFEPGPSGRLVEMEEDGTAFEIGKVLVWQPGRRLVFEWHNRNFVRDEITEVDLRFEAASRGTRVSLEHRGWSRLRSGHPVRHGLAGRDFTRMMGSWWADLLGSLREHAARARQDSSFRPGTRTASVSDMAGRGIRGGGGG